jgi:hypothetical protein
MVEEFMKTLRQLIRLEFLAAFAVALVVLAATSGQSMAQQMAPSPNATVPAVVQFGGVLRDETGKPMSGVVGVTFLLYRDQQGGAPLWLETQNVQPDKTGHYSVMLGSTGSHGLPTDIFVAGEARWLAVQAQGLPEQPRVMLLSVPYALKAGDAETVGGLPPSAFVLAAPAGSSAILGSTAGNSSAASAAPAPPVNSNVTTTGGTVNVLPLFTAATNIQNSALTQTGSGATAKIGIGTTTPTATLDVKGGGTIRGLLTLPAMGTATASGGFNSQPSDFVTSVFNSSAAKALPQTFQFQAEPVGNNTPNAGGSLNLLFAQGTGKPTETGLNIASNGQIAFAKGQTFPGAGTITGVTPGPGLTGGGTSGSVNLSVPNGGITNPMLQNSSVNVNSGTALTGGGPVSLGGSTTLSLDTTQVPLLNAGLNTFNGSQNINGSVSILNNATYQPLFVQSSSTFGTWLQLINTSAGGHNWAFLSAGGANSEGAGNLGITNFTGNSNIFLEGKVVANSLSVNNDTPMSSNPRMSFSAFIGGSWCGDGTCGCLANCAQFVGPGGFFIPDKNITITRITGALRNAIDTSCLGNPYVGIFSAFPNQLRSLTYVSVGSSTFDSGPHSESIPAGTPLQVWASTTVACNFASSGGGDGFINVEYVMQ